MFNGPEMKRDREEDEAKQKRKKSTAAASGASHCDINSLCSEPVNLWPDCRNRDFGAAKKALGDEQTALSSEAAAAVTSISLSDLGFFAVDDDERGGRRTFTLASG